MKFTTGAGGLALALVLAACPAEDPVPRGDRRPRPVTSPTSTDSRIIGLVTTTSGESSWRGEDAIEGAEVAVQLLNRSLPEGSSDYELVTLNDQDDPARATELVGRLASLDRTVGIIYAGPFASLPQVERTLASARIPMIVCYGDPYSGRILSPHVFQASPPYLWQARRIASYLLEDRAYERVGVLVERTADGATARAALGVAMQDARSVRPIAARYGPTVPSLRKALRRLRQAGTEAIVFHGDPDRFHSVAEILRARGWVYRTTRRARPNAPGWRPQLVGLDLATLPRSDSRLPIGTIAAETYARGAHYLPVPSFERFRQQYVDWWLDSRPVGFELRAYDATRVIGWAAEEAARDEDVALAMERLEDRRFGGLNVTLGPDDHTLINQTNVGLWVIPRRGIKVLERRRELLAENFPWVPLSRGFSIDGDRTDIYPQDWKHLFWNPPPPRAPAPKLRKLRYGVATPESDPIH